MDELELLALAAKAKKARAAQPKGWGQTLRENLLGDDDPNSQNFGEKVGSLLNKAGESATFGLVGDEASAAAESAFGADYETRRDHYRQQEEVLERDNPKAALTAEIGGALVAPVGALGALPRGASLATRTGASSAATAGMSGIYGGMEAEGSLDDRRTAALQDGQVGAMIGGAIPLVGAGVQKVANALAGRKGLKQAVSNAPSREQFKTMTRDAYRAVDDAGVQVTPQAFDRLRGNMANAMSDGLDDLPGRSSTPGGVGLVRDTGRMAAEMAKEPTAALPFSSLDKLRRRAGNVAGSVDNIGRPQPDANVGMAAKGAIDDFVSGLKESDLVEGDVQALNSAISKARELYSRSARADVAERAIDRADHYLSGPASGIKNQFKNILQNPKTARQFSDLEKKLMRRAINGSIPQQVVGLLGGGLGRLMQMAGGASAAGLPGAIAGAATGAVARSAADRIAMSNAEVVRAVMASGMRELPQANPAISQVTEQLMRRGTAGALQ